MLGDLIHHFIESITSNLPDPPDLPDLPSLHDLTDSSPSLLDHSDHVVDSVQPHFGIDLDSSATYTLPSDNSVVSGDQLKADVNGNWYRDQYDYNHSINPIDPKDVEKSS